MSKHRVTRYNHGPLQSEEWTNDWGERHREDGPAWISYDTTGRVEDMTWWDNGVLHRTDGPAAILNFGKIKQYYLFGFPEGSPMFKQHSELLKQHEFDKVLCEILDSEEEL